jgi:hypothetical protein
MKKYKYKSLHVTIPSTTTKKFEEESPKRVVLM